ncbi:hypothetical protein STEG23_028280 [Scotinomys teguina]
MSVTENKDSGGQGEYARDVSFFQFKKKNEYRQEKKIRKQKRERKGEEERGEEGEEGPPFSPSLNPSFTKAIQLSQTKLNRDGGGVGEQRLVIANSLIILTTTVQPLKCDTPANIFNSPMKFRTSLGSTTYRETQFSSGVTCG